MSLPRRRPPRASMLYISEFMIAAIVEPAVAGNWKELGQDVPNSGPDPMWHLLTKLVFFWVSRYFVFPQQLSKLKI